MSAKSGWSDTQSVVSPDRLRGLPFTAAAQPPVILPAVLFPAVDALRNKGWI